MALISSVWLLRSTLPCEVKVAIDVPEALHQLFFLGDWKSHKVFSNLTLIQITRSALNHSVCLRKDDSLIRLKSHASLGGWEAEPAPPNRVRVRERGGVLQRVRGGGGLELGERVTDAETTDFC